MSARHLVPVAWRTQIFTGDVKHLAAPEGLSLAEIVMRCEGLPPQFENYGVICVNGEIIPRAMWEFVRPRVRPDMDIAVTLHVRLAEGGGSEGGGGKDILATVATIAVVAAAAFVSGGALVPLLGASFAAGTIGAAVAGAAVGLAGSLAVSALSPPPAAAANETGSTLQSPGGTAQQGSASIRGNVLSPGAPIPRVAGTARVFPPLASPPLIETIGEDQFAEAVFILAGPHQIQDVRIGSIPISEMDEVSFEISEGLPASVLPALVARQSKTENVQLEVSVHQTKQSNGQRLVNQNAPQASIPQWHRLVTRTDPDEVWIRLAWPRGLWDENDGSPLGVPIRIRLRKRGDSAWVNLPEMHFRARRLSAFQRVIKIKWEAAPTLLPTPPDEDGFYAAFITTPGQTAFTPNTSGFDADASFDADAAGDHYLIAANTATSDLINIALYQDRAEVFLNPADKDTYEIEIKLGMPHDAEHDFAPASYQLLGAVYDLFGYYIDTGFARIAPDIGDNAFEPTLPSISSIWNEHPVASSNFSVISLRVHNRQLGELSVLASGYLPVFDGSVWDNVTTSSNPADWFRDILSGPYSVDPVPLDIVDEAEILTWRAHCVTKGYTVNAVIEGRSAMDALLMVSATGYARPRQSEKWGVMWDRDRSADAPVQVFSPRNLSAFRWEKAFTSRPDGFRVTYRNASKDYSDDELIVLDPQQDSGGSRLEAVSYDGLVNEADASARALFDLRQGAARMTFYHGTADWESIVCTRGDLVAVQHDIIAHAAGFSRVKSITESGGNLTGITLDGTVANELDNYFLDEDDASRFYLDEADTSRFYQDPELGIAIQGTDGTFFVKKVTGASEDEIELVFDVPFDDQDLIVPGAHVVSGALGSEYSSMILLDIAARDEFRADLTFVDEAPEIFA